MEVRRSYVNILFSKANGPKMKVSVGPIDEPPYWAPPGPIRSFVGPVFGAPSVRFFEDSPYWLLALFGDRGSISDSADRRRPRKHDRCPPSL